MVISDFRLIPAHAGKTSGPSARRTPTTAHPRSRGENARASLTSARRRGSSPLTRGKRTRSRRGGRRPRLIPAHAGKTKTRAAASLSSTAHPRSRGENLGASSTHSHPWGSSPLTRGKPQNNRAVARRPGLIPAHAGKTPPAPSRRCKPRAHPRSRGENPYSASARIATRGSSPLTRGKQTVWCAGEHRVRLIPAHAGKTDVASQSMQANRAHPRSRGENCARRPSVVSATGSSPLTRGKLGDDAHCVRDRRLIPAHAGKTPTPTRPSPPRRAHPRSRGENPPDRRGPLASQGSSPLTRGKRECPGGVPAGGGLIPAHAGKTQWGGAGLATCWAHPRSRGENAPFRERSFPHVGSSPLTRGKLPIALGDVAAGRLIPAHAGKTYCAHHGVPFGEAHPRSRGENRVAVYEVTQTGGSSPLTRGKLLWITSTRASWGLIPAHAGKTRPGVR
mgnify:CR=1 FL=1